MISALTSKYALEWRGIFVVSLPTVLIIPAAEVAPGYSGFWPLALANLISLLAAILVIALFSKLNGIRKAWILVLLAGGMAGAAKGALTWWLANLWAIGQPALWSRIGFGFTSWVVLVALMATIQQTIGSSSNAREAVISRLRGARRQFNSLEEQRDWLVRTKLEGMDRDLAEEFVDLLSQLNKEGKGPDSIRDIAQKLRRVARGKVRDASFANWRHEANVSDLFRSMLSASPNPLIFALLFGFPAIANTLRTNGESGAILSITLGSIAAAVFLQVNRLKYGHLLSPVIVAGLELATQVLFADELHWPTVLSSLTWSTTALLLASSIELVRLRNEKLRQLAESDLQHTESEIEWLTLQLETTNIEIAKYLHSVVQTRLMSHALLVEQGGFDEGAKEQLIEILSSPMRDFGPAHKNLGSALDELQREWSTMLEIGIEKNCSDDEAVSSTTLILREAIANAVHHGEATQVGISITDLDGLRIIRAEDNGVGPKRGSSGLGSQTFDSLAENWHLSSGPQGGTVLEVSLRLS